MAEFAEREKRPTPAIESPQTDWPKPQRFAPDVEEDPYAGYRKGYGRNFPQLRDAYRIEDLLAGKPQQPSPHPTPKPEAPTFSQTDRRWQLKGSKAAEVITVEQDPHRPGWYRLRVEAQGQITGKGTISAQELAKLDLHGGQGRDVFAFIGQMPKGMRVYGDSGPDVFLKTQENERLAIDGGSELDAVYTTPGVEDRNFKPVPETPVQQFQRELKENAVARLQQNQARLTQVQNTYQNTQPSNGQWSTLRTLAARDQQLKQLQDQTSQELMTLVAKKEFSNSPLGRLVNQTPLGEMLGLPKSDPINNQLLLNVLGMSPQAVDPKYREQFTALRERMELLYTVRQEMRAVHPAIAVIDTAKAAELENTPENNAILYRQMSEGFDGMREGMNKLSAAVTQDPSKALLFDALVPQTLGMFKSPQEQQQIQQWLKQQQDKDAALKLIGGLGTLGLTAGGFLAGPLGWGANVARGLFLGGSILGAATAAYEFPQLQMMDLAAKAGEAGGDKLTNQTPEEARMNLILGYGNLALAGLDGVALAPAVVAKLMKVPSVVRAAGSMTQAQSRVLLNSLSRLSGDVTDAVLEKVVQAIKGGATEVELPGVGRIKLSELDDNQPMRMQGTARSSGGTGTAANIPKEIVDKWSKTKNWKEVEQFIGQQAGADLPDGYYYRTLKKGTPDEHVVINRPWGKGNDAETVPLQIGEDGTFQVTTKTTNRISKPAAMRKNFEKAYGKLQPGYWIHHLIPDEIMRSNAFAKFARQVGYDLDRASNLEGLAGKEEWARIQTGQAKAPGKGYSDAVGHWSSHDKYSRQVSDYLDLRYKELEQE
ncbi:MAG: AHH domain-containing protein, partial [Thermosynechococcaceae cyanobacterium]